MRSWDVFTDDLCRGLPLWLELWWRLLRRLAGALIMTIAVVPVFVFLWLPAWGLWRICAWMSKVGGESK
jgi:hypothetical protein